jgi:hypothetical protein
VHDHCQLSSWSPTRRLRSGPHLHRNVQSKQLFANAAPLLPRRLRRDMLILASERDRSASQLRVASVRHVLCVDVTEEFPFLVTKLSPYFHR